jgi:hypothetical protein
VEEVTAHFKCKDEHLILTLKHPQGMIVHFDYSPEATKSVEAMMVGMKAIYNVLLDFSGEEEANRAMQELAKRLEPVQN